MIFSDDLYQIAINITDPAGYTTSYGYNARWQPETITDTYNTTATNPLAQVRNWTNEDGESRQQTYYFNCDKIGIPRKMTDKDGNLLWYG